ERDRLGKADDAELRRGVIRLAEVPDQARGRGHVDVAARLLRLEMRRSGARDVERAVEVHLDDRAPFLDRHIEEEAVAQDAGVIDHHIELSKRIDRGLDNPVGRFPLGDAVGVRDRRAAGGADLVDHLLRRAGVAAFAFHRGADIVHQHACAGGGEREREIAADAAARAGDERGFTFEELQSRKPGYLLSTRRNSPAHSSSPMLRRWPGLYLSFVRPTTLVDGWINSVLLAMASAWAWQARSSQWMVIKASGMVAPTASRPWLRRTMATWLPRSVTRRRCSSRSTAGPLELW